MKLLFVRTSKNYSGAEQYNVNLLRELRKNSSLEIYYLTNLYRLAEKLNRINIKGQMKQWLPTEVGTKRQLLNALFCAPVYIPRYLKTAKSYDVICFQSRTEMIFVTPFLKLLNRKVVWIQHGPFYNSQAAGIIKTLYRWASRFVTKIIAVSEDTKRDLMKGGVDGRKIKVIYIGVPVPKVGKISHKQFTIGFLGTLTKEKGTVDFVSVVSLLRSINTSKQKYLVVGDGPERGAMEKQTHAEFTGFVSDVKKYLSKIDVLLLPTHHHEGISMAILEAQAMGIPVLTTDIGGNKEIITHGYNGYLYNLDDTKSMVRDLQRLSINQSKLHAMGEHARQAINKRFNITIQAKAFAKFIKSL